MPKSIRPGYHEALRWVALNDDTNFLEDDDPIPSVSVCLIADLWRKETDTTLTDLRHTVTRLKKENSR